MRIYLYEMVSGGGALLPANITRKDTCLSALDDFHRIPSLVSDGSKMLEQLVQLFLRMPEMEVWVSVDSRLKDFGRKLQAMTNTRGESPMVLYADPSTPWAVFEECCRGADKSLVIAPELAGLLDTAVGKCLIAGGDSLGAARQLLKLGIDKSSIHRWAEQFGIPMPDWGLLVNGAYSFQADEIICKPLLGTGGVGICEEESGLPVVGTWLLERKVAGVAVSVAAIVTAQGFTLLPPCYQHLGGEWGFEFQGATLIEDGKHQQRAWRLAHHVFSKLPLENTRGWIGLDLILGEKEGDDVLIEVNPRVTSTIEILNTLDAFVPYQSNRSTNVTELMLAAATGK